MDVLEVLQFDEKNGYAGGIANIVKDYADNADRLVSKDGKLDCLNISNLLLKTKSRNKFRILVSYIHAYRMLMKFQPICGYDIIHIHSSRGKKMVKDLIFTRGIKRRFKKHIILTIHYCEISNIFNVINIRAYKYLLKFVDQLIVLSERTKEEIIESGIFTGRIDVVTTYHKYDFKVDDLVKGKSNETINLLFMGSIDRRKGILDLLKAVKKSKNDKIRLTVCGKVTEEAVGKEFNELKEDEKIKFLGYTTGEEKMSLLMKSDVLVLPSYGEGMPIVIMEGLAAGNMIISTRVGAVPEIISSSNGVLIKPGDIDGLIEILDSLLKEKLKEYIAVNVSYSLNFSLDNHLQKIRRIYDGTYNND